LFGRKREEVGQWGKEGKRTEGGRETSIYYVCDGNTVAKQKKKGLAIGGYEERFS